MRIHEKRANLTKVHSKRESMFNVAYMQQIQAALQTLRGPVQDLQQPLIYINNNNSIPPVMKLIGTEVEMSGYSAAEYKQVSLSKSDLEFVLAQPGFDINEKDMMGQTALHLAVQYCSIAAVQRLLSVGADMSLGDCDGLIPTHYAAMAGRLDTLKLLPRECLCAADTKSNRLPIHYAALCGRSDVLSYLLEESDVIDPQDSHGNTPLVLAVRYGHPAVAQLLIEGGADPKLVDNDDIPVLALVNQQYITLGSQILDRYVTPDEFTNTVEIRVKPIIETKTKSCRTFYHSLVTCNSVEEATDHYVVCNITSKKWDLFAKRYFTMLIILIIIFNLFWTVIYTWPPDHENSEWFFVIAAIVALLGIVSLALHTAAVAWVTFKQKKFHDCRVKAINNCHNYEKAHLHHQQSHYIKQLRAVKTEVLGHYGMSKPIALMLFNLARNILLALYLANKIHAFVSTHIEKSTPHVISIDIAISIVILTTWLQLFNTLGISSTVGRFVVFTKEVVKDIGSVFMVYSALFIPMTVIFWKTIYSHAEHQDLEWYDTPFNVLRMTIVDYDYDLGKSLARDIGVALWWDILSLTWLILSGLIILNLFIALMADRYARLGNRSTSICNNMRAQFVFSCELIMGPTRVNYWEDIILKSYGTLTCKMADDSQQIEKDLTELKEQLVNITKKLDKALNSSIKTTSNKTLVEDVDTNMDDDTL